MKRKDLEKRKKDAYKKRVAAAKIACDRTHPKGQKSNGEEKKFVTLQGEKTYLMNFTKGLEHDSATGLVKNPDHYKQFVKGIQDGDPDTFEDTPLGPGRIVTNGAHTDCKFHPKWTSEKAQTSGKSSNGQAEPVNVRAWESAGAGLTFSIQGPDSMAVTMPPAPALGSDELTAEMAEVYVQALLRDVPLTAFFDKTHKKKYIEEEDWEKVEALIGKLCELPFFKDRKNHTYDAYTEVEKARITSPFDAFRGITPGDKVGPYISQFMLAGNTGINSMDKEHDAADGYITYGPLRIDQRVRTATIGKDYMKTWDEWLDVQNGADLRGLETYESGNNARRFITTARDLSTYVHYDALYQAYLNACLILLSAGASFDKGIPFQGADIFDRQQGFAHYGGPHILTLVPEVATRALKAVRFQKFNVHRRLRPEALAARVTMYDVIAQKCVVNKEHGIQGNMLEKMKDNLKDILDHVDEQNPAFQEGYQRANHKEVSDYYAAYHNGNGNGHHPDLKEVEQNYLLPMAFCEGSPMHPSYGAGHATVAGACVTILKAFFNTALYIKIAPDGSTIEFVKEKPDQTYAFVPNKDGSRLETIRIHDAMTLEGELNKLAANISIGRNWAGVHYYSDYTESLKMGEEIAISILEEQSVMYNPEEELSMSLTKFNGECIVIKDGERHAAGRSKKKVRKIANAIA